MFLFLLTGNKYDDDDDDCWANMRMRMSEFRFLQPRYDLFYVTYIGASILHPLGPSHPKLPNVIAPWSVYVTTSAKFGPDWLAFAGVIPEKLLFQFSKSLQCWVKACIQTFRIQLRMFFGCRPPRCCAWDCASSFALQSRKWHHHHHHHNHHHVLYFMLAERSKTICSNSKTSKDKKRRKMYKLRF